MSDRLFDTLIPDWECIKRLYIDELSNLIYWSMDIDPVTFKELHLGLKNVDSFETAFDFCLKCGYQTQEIFDADEIFDDIRETILSIKNEYERRFEVARNHIQYGNLLVQEQRPRLEWDKIKLVDFGDWALSLDYELPDEFPRSRPPHYTEYLRPVYTIDMGSFSLKTNKPTDDNKAEMTATTRSREGKGSKLVNAIFELWKKKNEGLPSTANELWLFGFDNQPLGYSKLKKEGKKISFVEAGESNSLQFRAFEKAFDELIANKRE